MKTALKLLFIHGSKSAAKTETGQAVTHSFFSFLPELIFVAVIAALVFGICRWTESEAVKKLKTSDSDELKNSMGRVNLWVWLYLAAFACLTVLTIFGMEDAEEMDDGEGDGSILSVLLILSVFAVWAVGFWQMTVSFWTQIPNDIARTTPQKAAWYSFIPVFNWYWWFVAFRGLVDDLNKTASRHGHGNLVGLSFATAACSLWVLDGLSDFIPFGTGGVILLLLTVLVLTFIFFLTLRNGMARLLLCKTTNEDSAINAPG